MQSCQDFLEQTPEALEKKIDSILQSL